MAMHSAGAVSLGEVGDGELAFGKTGVAVRASSSCIPRELPSTGS